MRSSVFILFIILISCKKEDKYVDVAIYGHAGDGIDISTAPYQENTKEAIEYAFSYPEIKGVEIDLQWSADNTIWLYHDNDLSEQTTSSGIIQEKSDEELSKVHYKGLNAEKLTRLSSVLSLMKGKKVLLDIKFVNGAPLTLMELQSSLEEIIPISQEIDLGVILQNMDYQPYFQSLGWKTYLNVESSSHYLSYSGWDQTTGCCISNSLINSKEVSSLRNNYNKEVIIFSARAPKTIRIALKKRPTIFLADDIRATLIEKIR